MYLILAPAADSASASSPPPPLLLLLCLVSKTGFLCVIVLAVLELAFYTRFALTSRNLPSSTCASALPPRMMGKGAWLGS